MWLPSYRIKWPSEKGGFQIRRTGTLTENQSFLVTSFLEELQFIMSVIFFEIYWKPWAFDRVIWHENVVNWPNPSSLNFVHICSTVWLTDLFNSRITPRAFPWTCKIRLCHALNVWPSNFTRNPTQAEGWTICQYWLWHVFANCLFRPQNLFSFSGCFLNSLYCAFYISNTDWLLGICLSEHT